MSYEERRNCKVKYISKKAKVLVSESDTNKSESVESEEPDCTPFSDMPFSAFSELHTPDPLEASTPIQLNRVDEMVEYSSSSEAEDQSDTPKSDSEDFICENSIMSETQFSDDLLSVIDQHALSDRAAKSVLNLIEKCLPKKNQSPFFYRLQQIENSFSNVKQKTQPDGVIYHLDVENQLHALLE